MRWWRNRQRDEEMDRELRDHLELEAEEQRESGLPPDEAFHAAKRAFGNTTLVAEAIRETRMFAWFGAFAQDVRYGARMLRKNPGFTAVAVCTLALGIGANTAIFSVVNAVLLNRMPYADASRLAVLWEQRPELGWYRNVVSAANFIDWRKQNHVFTGMAAVSQGLFDLSGTGQPLEVRGEQVSADFFRVLGVRAALGRTFTPEEDQPGGPRVAVLSNQLWKERFGGDPALVGREITVNRARFMVIGVLPAEFHFPPWEDKAALWITGLDLRNPERTWHAYQAIGRLQNGVTLQQAQAEMDTIARRLEKQYPEQKGWGVQLVDLHEQVVGDTRPALLVLLAAVGMVLLIACANLANLQLARVAAREKELAVRAALGGARHRLVRQLLTECLLVAMIGGGLGVLLAWWGVKLLVVLGPQSTPGLDQASVSLGVLAFTLLLSILTGIAFGLIPALSASKIGLNHSLKESTRGSTEGVRRKRLGGVLVCAEFALALVLLAGAGLLIRSFVALSGVQLGFDPHKVLSMRIALLGQGYAEQGRQVEFFRSLLQSVQALPGVVSAAVIDGDGLPPICGSGMDFLIEGRPIPPPSDRPDAVYRTVSPDYFRTMQIPLVRGRYFAENDDQASPRVAVINERLARDHWPGQDPVGHRVRWPGLGKGGAAAGIWAGGAEPVWVSIVGVVKNVKNRGPEIAAMEEVYVPYNQLPVWFTPGILVVRASGNPNLLVSAIRQRVAALDKDQPISEIKLVDEIVAEAEAGHRFPMILLGLFAGLALALAGIGIYGVMSYSVTQRVHELGIRMALGAQRRDVIRTIAREGLRPAIWGLAVGLAGALAATHAMSRLLFGVGATDPLTFIAVSATLLAIGVLAISIPARRATAVDPMVALRHE
jgi:putative ABC transport system permease protein